jgi:hypothetical protein
VKAQAVRAIDVAILGPWLAWLALRPGRRLTDTDRALLLTAGALTVLYNARNYLRVRRSSPGSRG